MELCYSPQHLHLVYQAREDRFLKNTYTQCNSETYNQEVLEVFIAPHTNDSITYHEVRHRVDAACACGACCVYL